MEQTACRVLTVLQLGHERPGNSAKAAGNAGETEHAWMASWNGRRDWQDLGGRGVNEMEMLERVWDGN